MPNFYWVSLLESRLIWNIAKYHNTKFSAVGILFLYKQEQLTFRNKNAKNWTKMWRLILVLLLFCASDAIASFNVKLLPSRILSNWHSFHFSFCSFSLHSMWNFLYVAFSPCDILSVWHFLGQSQILLLLVPDLRLVQKKVTAHEKFLMTTTVLDEAF